MLLAPTMTTIVSFAQRASTEEMSWRHGLSLSGQLKYPGRFAHFAYVNPRALKLGTVRQGAFGTYDNFNVVASGLKGNLAAGIDLIYEQLLTPSLDEVSAAYGLLADAVSYPPDISSVTFRLRPQARWHDGASIKPHGVIFSFDAFNTYNPRFSVYYRHVRDAEVTGERELTFTFDGPGNRELPLILGQLTVLPKHVPYGKEPIPLLQALAKDYGYTLKLYPVPPTEMQDQDSVWLDVRRDRPDWLYLQGWGAMNPTAVEEAAKNGFKVDHLIGVWWSGGDQDARPAGSGGKGYSTLDINGVGQNYPAIQNILKYVVDKGKSQVMKDQVGENLYDRGIMNAVLIAEGIRNAQKLTGKKQIDGADMRRGLESLNISEARWKELGFPGFAEPIHLSCADHNAHNNVFLVQWDGTKWMKQAGSIAPIHDKVQPLINSAAEQYVKANTGWPKRTEPCEKSS